LGRLFAVEMGKSQGIRCLNSKDEVIRDTFGVGFDCPCFRKLYAARKKAPEPLVYLDRIQVLRIIGKVVMGAVIFAFLVIKTLPRVVLPGTRADA